LTTCCDRIKLGGFAKSPSAALNTVKNNLLDWKEFMRYG